MGKNVQKERILKQRIRSFQCAGMRNEIGSFAACTPRGEQGRETFSARLHRPVKRKLFYKYGIIPVDTLIQRFGEMSDGTQRSAGTA